ncbi:MAG: DUF86 domain-containing protein [bacterium]|nr:DUF86 domain-containing protein [bacterium]
MQKDNRIYLQDILDAVVKVEQYTKKFTQKKFATDELVQDAVIRNLELIGEAVGHLTSGFTKKHPDFPSHEAIAMRNFLIHQYDEIDVDILWETIQKDLPALKEQVRAIMAVTA